MVARGYVNRGAVSTKRLCQLRGYVNPGPCHNALKALLWKMPIRQATVWEDAPKQCFYAADQRHNEHFMTSGQVSMLLLYTIVVSVAA